MASHNKATLARKKNGDDGPVEESLTLQNQEIDTPVLPIEHMERLHAFRPDIIDWILRQTEEESKARRKRMTQIDWFIFIEKCVGQTFGLSIGVGGIVGGSYVAIQGHPTAGGAIASVAIGTLAVAFLGRQRQK